MEIVEAEAQAEQVWLVPWAEGDFWLLEQTNSPEMTAHLGGPESAEKLAGRHRRYVEPASGRMYRVTLAEGGRTVGSVGFWERRWRDSAIWETGWGILPEFQGRGLAAQAARALVEEARAAGGHRYLHAFPSVEHPASNGVCRRAGFTLLGQAEFEYPKGHWITSNDWRIDLTGGST
ncbi:GNAT family N-acetyltransferase [Streptomyces sp. NPDC048420]|uniref:GNAT family N-acetyltransferase n=1 Tax=Streptomyces sp. NPDC048420 TaxID=3155755 RepID=UPI0034159C6A